MIEVIQVFKRREVFTKEDYNPLNRKTLEELPKSITSESGYLEEKKLILPLAYKGQPENPELVILLDTLYPNTETARCWPEKTTDVLLFRQMNALKSFGIFKIKKSATGFELYLDYSSHSSGIGIPEREDHKLCDLKFQVPVHYRINGKADFTMTGRKKRTFYELDYLMEFIGRVDKIHFESLEQSKSTKTLPSKKTKLIDERKILF